MNEADFKNEIKNRWGHDRRRHGRVWAGLFLLLIGGLLLLKTMDVFFFPAWFFTWPVFVLAIGLFSGIKHGFRGGFWLIALLVGTIGLFDKIDPSLHLNRFTAPFIIIAIGLLFILRPKRSHWRRWHKDQGPYDQQPNLAGAAPDVENAYTTDRRDFIDITAVFGGVKKNVLTKNFQGGDIVSFMGGSEIDLTQADFSGRVTVDVTNIFGGTKLIVPPTWDVQSDITTIFGGVDDKRQVGGVNLDPDKVLILDGTCLFGGIDIRSF